MAEGSTFQDEQGNTYVDEGGGNYRQINPEMGVFDDAMAAAGQTITSMADLPNRVSEYMGQPMMFPEQRKQAEYWQQQYNQSPQGLGSIAGQIAPYAAGGALGAAVRGTAGVVGAEVLLSTAASKSIQEAVVNGSLAAVGGAAFPVGRKMFEMATVGGGPGNRIMSALPGNVGGQIREGMDTLATGLRRDATKLTGGRIGRPQVDVPGGGASGGAASRWGSEKLLDEAPDAVAFRQNLQLDEMPPEVSDLLDARVGGNVSEIEQRMGQFAATDDGRQWINDLDLKARDMTAKELGMEPGKFTMANLADHLDEVGKEIGDMLDPKAKIEPPAAEALEALQRTQEELARSADAGEVVFNRHFDNYANAQTVQEAKEVTAAMRKDLNGKKGQEYTTALGALRDMEKDLMERMKAGIKPGDEALFSQRRYQYMLGKTIQENPTIYSKGKFSPGALERYLEKGYLPMKHGVNQSDYAETIKGIIAIKQNWHKGSPTYDRAKANAVKGLIGTGVLGGVGSLFGL